MPFANPGKTEREFLNRQLSRLVKMGRAGGKSAKGENKKDKVGWVNDKRKEVGGEGSQFGELI